MFNLMMKLSTLKLYLFSIFASTIFGACSSIPEGIEAVDDLDIDKYAGTWYEIARMDSRFEKNLVNVTATYTLQDGGNIEVKNRGYDTIDNKWNDIVGKAKLANDEKNSMLKVSFFGPFYAGYNIIALDQEDYSYALVCGSDKDYLWVLAREPNFSSSKTQELIATAKELGFDTDKLVMVPQEGSVE
jgi:apolipoprotein D and lipocalin family protein